MNKHLPQISIIIPVYNVASYLPQGLDALMKQTYANFEAILVNDGSTDNSYSICEEYMEKDSRFRLFSQKNAGLSEARNTGLKHACGEYITFMDSDDWPEETWLEAYVEVIALRQPDYLIQGVIVDNGIELRKECAFENFYERKELFDAFCHLEKRGLAGFVHNKMYKTSLITQNNLKFRLFLHEDMLFNIDYLCCAHSLAVLPTAHYHYMQRNNNSLVRQRYPFNKMMQLNTALRDTRVHMADVFDKNGYREEAIARYMAMYTILLVSLYDKNRGVKNRKERLKILQAYRCERRKYRQLHLAFTGFWKKCFSHLAKVPPVVFDLILNLAYTIKK